MPSIRILAWVAPALLALATACSGGSSPQSDAKDLPQGQTTLRQAAAAMRNLKSVGLAISTEGQPPLSVRGGDVKLLRSGDARGVLRLQQAGQTFEMDFVLLGQTVYFKGATGGYQKVSKTMVAAVYDPSAVLDPERGIAKVLTTVTGATPEAREKVNGRQAYRLRVTLPRATAGTLIPGITRDLPGKMWIGADDHRLLRVRADLPATAGGSGSASSVTVSFTEFDRPYKITAPK